MKLNILRIYKRLFTVSLVQKSIDASLSKKKPHKKEVPFFFIKTKNKTYTSLRHLIWLRVFMRAYRADMNP